MFHIPSAGTDPIPATASAIPAVAPAAIAAPSGVDTTAALLFLVSLSDKVMGSLQADLSEDNSLPESQIEHTLIPEVSQVVQLVTAQFEHKLPAANKSKVVSQVRQISASPASHYKQLSTLQAMQVTSGLPGFKPYPVSQVSQLVVESGRH